MADLEAIRKENIQRNKDLLKKLNLDQLNASIARDASPKPKPAKRVKRVKQEPSLPTRKSRRLASAPEDLEEARRREAEEERAREAQQRLLEMRLRALEYDYKLADLVLERRLDQLRFEARVFRKEEDEKEVKQEANEEEASAEAEQKVLDELLQSCDASSDAKSANALKNASLSDREWPAIKLTMHRITSMAFHSLARKLIFAGDTNGEVGAWVASETEPTLLTLKPHGRTVSRIVEVPSHPEQMLTASYDGSCRIMDLHKQVSNSLLRLADAEGYRLGVSDVALISPKVGYLTTLEGQFLQFDLREKNIPVKYSLLRRLHDKKIGGFCVNPNADHQLATASLDRTMKIWDLRTTVKKLDSDIDDGLASCHLYGTYTSRLSVSTVDWNSNNRIVCNGYDDEVNVFNLKDIASWKKTHTATIEPTTTIRHNCQSGRWVLILKARWQKNPLDNVQKFAIANMNRSIDIYNESGKMFALLADPDNMTAVPAVVAFHPLHNWIVGGSSSGKAFLFE